MGGGKCLGPWEVGLVRGRKGDEGMRARGSDAVSGQDCERSWRIPRWGGKASETQTVDPRRRATRLSTEPAGGRTPGIGAAVLRILPPQLGFRNADPAPARLSPPGGV